jgi:hypothetical protein
MKPFFKFLFILSVAVLLSGQTQGDGHSGPSTVTEGAKINVVNDYTYAFNLLPDIEIPATVTHIKYAAYRNNHLSNISIPASVVSIAGWAFANNKLADVTVPSPLHQLGRALLRTIY